MQSDIDAQLTSFFEETPPRDFAKVMRGYDPHQVDEHIRGLASEVRRHQEEAISARRELTDAFAARTRAQWVEFFIDEDVAGSPVYLGADVLDDGHVTAHGLVIDQPQPDGGTLRLLGTPIRLPGSRFDPAAAPTAGADTEAVLGELRSSVAQGEVNG